ncbi:iron complex outermembrane recepter protein [Methylomarinovum caldicuralii]|uniref:Iron complex outermembrane recepter protein n=1 Tax=Methylomarinovum caldicuralii TaxID=438856 RepID=A0AAU9C767_9GAMM|nr:TonB-dependent receptor [Methylomarinovum caldicuralii]BCX81854.1 iron complex outermembrane recepter protein [Methylomarinovum caldicuralii]
MKFRVSLLLLAAASAAVAEEVVELGTLEVVGTTPLGLSGVPLDDIPANVQVAGARDFERSQSYSLADYLRTQLGSVVVNDAQNNPFQPDIQYRGFTASPLLGLPQGLTVYFNGVRFNEPFGDTVNWDLIPQGAIERMELHPGSDPVYGLNTLGGAIAIRSKTGFSFPHHQLKVYGGSWGRHSESLSSGWNNGSVGYFLHLRHFEEDGWRDFSPTRVKQAFGVLSWRGQQGQLNLTLSGQDNDLTGNGAVPIQLYRQKQRAIFTHPDDTGNRLFFSNLDGSFWLNDKIQLTGNTYYRYNKITTFNGDDTDFEECEPPLDDFMCDEEGEIAEDVNGEPIEATDAVESATNNFSRTRQKGYGVAFQTHFLYDPFDMNNHLITGFSFDQAQIRFSFDTELARLTEDRGTVGSGVLAGESRVRLDNEVTHYGAFFIEQFSPIENLTLTASGRFNSSHIRLNDNFGEELNGRHHFSRFNPAGGLVYKLLPNLNLYGRYSESNRAPTAVELTCADPDDPCRLPNAFLADPPLKQVVAKTFEAGFRGRFDRLPLGSDVSTALQWHAGYFHTMNHDDILFISAGNLTSEGYFDNVGKTRRQGLEASLNGIIDNPMTGIWLQKLRYGFNYTYLDATFRTPFTAPSPNNPSADAAGNIHVERGDRIPGLPEHSFKFNLDVDVIPQFTLGMTGIYSSDRYFRGDEANLNKPVPGYWVFNLRAEYRVHEHVNLFLRVDNLFDKRYQTFGLYGQPDEVLGDEFDDPRFIGPGAPRGIWGGVRLQL